MASATACGHWRGTEGSCRQPRMGTSCSTQLSRGRPAQHHHGHSSAPVPGAIRLNASFHVLDCSFMAAALRQGVSRSSGLKRHAHLRHELPEDDAKRVDVHLVGAQLAQQELWGCSRCRERLGMHSRCRERLGMHSRCRERLGMHSSCPCLGALPTLGEQLARQGLWQGHPAAAPASPRASKGNTRRHTHQARWPILTCPGKGAQHSVLVRPEPLHLVLLLLQHLRQANVSNLGAAFARQ